MPELNAFGVRSSALGYGRFYLNMVAALRDQGVTVYDRMVGTVPSAWHTLNQGKVEGLAATACWFSYPTHAPGWWEGQYSAAFTMWETMLLPETLRSVLDNYHLVIVPSEQNVELFSQWHDNVRYVPLGIDPAVWQPTKRQQPERYFRFFTSGNGPRKGGDLVRKAFYRLWSNERCWPSSMPTPVLLMKSIKGGMSGGPRIEIIPDRLTDEDERALYDVAHCYIQPSRGEGFGLQPLQAIASGMPTILTDAHGHKAFSHLGLGLSSTLEHNSKSGGYFSMGESGDWWEPNFDELCDWMLYVYENYDQAATTAYDNGVQACEQFTWESTARQFLGVFPEGQFDKPAPQPTVFRELTQRRYLVRVDRAKEMDIAGIVHRFEPGRDYWEPADLKRLLFDGGWLSVDCTRMDDPGLTPEQVAQLDTYSSDHAFCPTCHQQLNSGVYKDQLEAV